jgi:hypothetical protein
MAMKGTLAVIKFRKLNLIYNRASERETVAVACGGLYN